MRKFLSLIAVIISMILVVTLSSVGFTDENVPEDKQQSQVRKEVKVIKGKDGQTYRVETIIVDDGNGEAKSEKKVETKFEINGDGVDVRLENGKLIIRHPDGTEQKIDLPAVDGIELPELKARDIELDIEVEDAENPQKADVDVDVQIKGKAIIVDSDGNVREIELGPDAIVGDGAGNIIGGPLFNGAIEGEIFELPIPLGEYMIGVGIAEAGATLRSQLSLDEGVGVVVNHVGEGSPAAKAGIQVHDVIVSAGDRVVHDMAELVDIVNKNGEKEQSISVTLIRKGEKTTVEVTPTKRPEIEIEDAPLEGLQGKGIFPGFRGIPKGDLRAYGIPEEDLAEIQKHIQEEMKRFQGGGHGHWQRAPVFPRPYPQPNAAKQNEVLEKLEKRIRQLEERLESLESK